MRILITRCSQENKQLLNSASLVISALKDAGHSVHGFSDTEALGLDPDAVIVLDQDKHSKVSSSFPLTPIVECSFGPEFIPAGIPQRRTLTVYPCGSLAEKSDTYGRKAVIPFPVEMCSSPARGNTLFCPGPFNNGEGQRTLVKAMTLVSEEYTAVISGEEGDYSAADLFAIAENEGLGHRVRIETGHPSKEHRIGVAPSLTGERVYETVAVLMARGLPVLASSAGCHRDMVKDGLTGLYHTPGNHRQLAGQINHLMGNPGLCGYLTENALEFCENELSVAAVGRKWTRELEQLCSR